MTTHTRTMSDRHQDTAQVAPSQAMLQLISGFGLAHALHTAAELGLADLMHAGPLTSDELAARTGTHARSLRRVIRALAGAGVVVEEEGRFALTALGATLRSDVPGSLRAWARVALGEESRLAWSDLMHTLRTGETAFDHRFGCDVWEYRSRNPETARIFDHAMAGTQAVYNTAIIASYPFGRHRTLADIGGGDASFMIALLQAQTELNAVVFDLPHVVEHARRRIEASGLEKRCRVVAGDAFEAVPQGADAYVLSRVIHDWADERAIEILGACRKAIPDTGTLLLIERILPARMATGSAAKALAVTDLHMMVMNGGGERTQAAYEALLDRSGFELTRIVATASPMNVIEAAPA